MLSNIGTTEVLIVVIVLIVLFGAKRIADVGRKLGETTKELKNAKTEYEAALKDLPETAGLKKEEV